MFRKKDKRTPKNYVYHKKKHASCCLRKKFPEYKIIIIFNNNIAVYMYVCWIYISCRALYKNVGWHKTITLNFTRELLICSYIYKCMYIRWFPYKIYLVIAPKDKHWSVCQQLRLFIFPINIYGNSYFLIHDVKYCNIGESGCFFILDNLV